MNIKYTKQAELALEYAKDTAFAALQKFIGTEHILIGLVKENSSIASKVLAEQNIDEEKIKKLIDKLIDEKSDLLLEIKDIDYSIKSKRVLTEAYKEALKYKYEEVGTEHILLAMIKDKNNLATNLLKTLGVNIQRLYISLIASMGEQAVEIAKEIGQKENFDEENLSATPMLDKYSKDLTKMALDNKLDVLIGRENELNRLMQILSRRSKNNPVLVGEPGVGKTAIIEGLANKIANKDVPINLENKKLVSLDIAAMVAGSKYRGEFEERIKKVILEIVEVGNILIFIDEIHTIIGAGGAEGSIDASNILKPALARGQLQLIGATTLEEYRKYFEKDAALERRFAKIVVQEPNVEETIQILEGLRPVYEEHHKLQITNEAIEAAANLSARYISDRFLPDKAIDLIDEAASKARLERFTRPKEIKKLQDAIEIFELEKEELLKNNKFNKIAAVILKQNKKRERLFKLEEKWNLDKEDKNIIIKANDIAEVISNWTKIPIKKLAKEESKKLIDLEKTLKESVIGQDEAVVAIAKAIRRGRVGLKDPNKPIGSFLFLGPTGVGKTQISKSLASELFGTENALIRVDMSEYMEKHSVSKMIGSPPGYVGYEEGGQLSEKIRRNPYSIILFDEIEKAHPDVFNILLQVLDDGHITDSTGRKVDFKNTIIIMTSNAGAMNIVEPKSLGFTSNTDDKKEYVDMKSKVLEEIKQMFKPEFLNRIDEIIVFHQLNKDNMNDILSIMFKNINERISAEFAINLELSTEASNYIIDKAYDKKYGARPLKRALQNMIEDKLAELILETKIKVGSSILIDYNEELKELEFKKNKK